MPIVFDDQAAVAAKGRIVFDDGQQASAAAQPVQVPPASRKAMSSIVFDDEADIQPVADASGVLETAIPSPLQQVPGAPPDPIGATAAPAAQPAEAPTVIQALIDNQQAIPTPPTEAEAAPAPVPEQAVSDEEPPQFTSDEVPSVVVDESGDLPTGAIQTTTQGLADTIEGIIAHTGKGGASFIQSIGGLLTAMVENDPSAKVPFGSWVKQTEESKVRALEISKKVSEFGKEGQEVFEEIRPTKNIVGFDENGDFKFNKETAKDPEYWAGTALTTMSQVGTALITGGGSAGGAAIAGSVMEAAPFYEELRKNGMGPSEALARSLSFGVIVAGLEKIGFDNILKGSGAKKVLTRIILGLVIEPTTEWAENPAKVVAEKLGDEGFELLGPEVLDASLSGINDIPGAFLIGGGTTVTREVGTAQVKSQINKRKRAEAEATFDEAMLEHFGVSSEIQKEILIDEIRRRRGINEPTLPDEGVPPLTEPPGTVAPASVLPVTPPAGEAPANLDDQQQPTTPPPVPETEEPASTTEQLGEPVLEDGEVDVIDDDPETESTPAEEVQAAVREELAKSKDKASEPAAKKKDEPKPAKVAEDKPANPAESAPKTEQPTTAAQVIEKLAKESPQIPDTERATEEDHDRTKRARPGDTVGLNKKEIKQIRKDMDLGELPEDERRAWEGRLDNAKAKGVDRDADLIAKSVNSRPRAVTDDEHAGMVLRAAQLQNLHEEKLKQIDELVKTGDKKGIKSLQADINTIQKSLDELTAASDMAGREAARALSIRRMRINRESFRLSSLIQQARALKGKDISSKRRARITDVAGKIETLESELKTLNERYQKLEDASAQKVAGTVVQEAAEQVKKRRKKTGLKAKREAIKSELKNSYKGKVLDISGLAPEAARLIGMLAINYVQDGATTIKEVIEKVRTDVPELTDRDIWDSIAGRSKGETRRVRSEVSKRISDLKSQARLLAGIDDGVKGIFPETGGKAEPSKTVKELQARLDVMRESDRIIQRIDDALSGKIRQAKPGTKIPLVLDFLRTELKKLNDANSKPQRDAAKVAEIEATITKLEQQLESGLRDEKTMPAQESAAIVEAKKRLTETRTKLREADTVASLEAQIADAKKGKFKPSKARSKASAEVKALRKNLSDLRNLAYKTQLDDTKLTQIIEKIDKVRDQLETGVRDPKRTPKEVSTEVKAAQLYLTEIRSLMRTEDSIADLENQLATGDFKVTPRRQKKITLEALEKAQIKLQQLRREARDAVRGARPMTPGRFAAELLALPRTLLATADMSYALRQGAALSAGRPITALKTFGRAFQAFFSQNKADQIDLLIRQHPNQFKRDQAGLYLSPLGHGTLNGREEAFASNWAENIPVYGHVVKASERNMVSGLNMLRTAAFDSFANDNPNATIEELKAWANWVNIASGRGNLGKAAVAAEAMSAVIFAPRFAVSRIQTPFMLLWNARNPVVRKAIAKDFASFIGLGIGVLAFAKAAGWEVEDDPESSDWGKIIIGDTRIDIWFGLQQPVRLFMLPFLKGADTAGLRDLEGDIDIYDAAARFTSYKFAPLVTVPIELIQGENVIGQKTTPWKTLVNNVIPLVAQDIYDIAEDTGDLSKAAAFGAGAFVGVGIQHHSNRSKKRRSSNRRAKRRRSSRQ